MTAFSYLRSQGINMDAAPGKRCFKYLGFWCVSNLKQPGKDADMNDAADRSRAVFS